MPPPPTITDPGPPTPTTSSTLAPPPSIPNPGPMPPQPADCDDLSPREVERLSDAERAAYLSRCRGTSG